MKATYTASKHQARGDELKDQATWILQNRKDGQVVYSQSGSYKEMTRKLGENPPAKVLDGRLGLYLTEGDPYVVVGCKGLQDWNKALSLLGVVGGSYYWHDRRYGLRVVVKGTLKDVGGKYYWCDSRNRDFILEIHDRDYFVPYPDSVASFNTNAVLEAQNFLDKVVPPPTPQPDGRLRENSWERTHDLPLRKHDVAAPRRKKPSPKPLSFPEGDDNLTWALFYALEMKIPVLPLYEMKDGRCSCGPSCPENNQGKHPRITHGSLDATRNPEQIKKWWKRWPEANIGGRTGEVSGVNVMDGDTPEGVAFLQKSLPDTPSQITGSGTKHFFVLYELGLKNWRGVPPGFDIRTDNGYVVLPPSCNSKGVYSWDRITTRKPLSDEVREAIFSYRKKEKAIVESTSKKVRGALEDVASSWESVKDALEDIRDKFSDDEMIDEGERHIRLLEIGGTLRGRGVQEAKIERSLFWINESLCGPPLSEREFTPIVESVMKLKREINDLVDDFEVWLESQIFTGKSGGTDKKVVKTLLQEARRIGRKGLEGLEISISQLDLKDKVGVGYKTVNASLKRIPFIKSRRNKDLSKCSTVILLYPNGVDVDSEGEVMVNEFVREGDNPNICCQNKDESTPKKRVCGLSP